MMKKMKIDFDNKQMDLLNKIGFPFSLSEDLSDDDILLIDEKVSEYFQLNGIDNDRVNDIGLVCESIIDCIS
ncbi:hypothetical protein HMPREF9629_00627 [Peptoanaerobacter stomatis]|uniref:Uncharacterized protein n=2 Tax=Peptoanaerobacter stomatis TaxID=796937 RepID=G9X2M0_9FIRM|nr:hypothetical protein HMPREF9629_00627 [Peptoanaerobacter stomatis]